MDALRGSLSNAESFGRGFAVAPVGLLGDIEGLLRKGVNFSFGRGGVNVGETPVLPTTEGLLSSIPRMTAPRMETAGIEQIGSAANPRGPINLGRAVASLPSDVKRAGMEYLQASAQPRQIFVGPNSKTWNKQAADTAVQMEKAGASPRDIWEQTGTFRGAEGKLRQEISDKSAQWQPTKWDQPYKEAPEIDVANVGSALSHPELLKAYPELGQANIVLNPSIDALGSWNAANPSIGLHTPYMQLNETLNPYAELDWLKRMQDPNSIDYWKNQARYAIKEGFSPRQAIKDMRQHISETEQKVQQMNQGVITGSPSTALHELQHGVQHIEDFARGGNPQSVMTKIQQQNPETYTNLINQQKSLGDIYDDAYKRLAGEAEARLTQTRKNLTPEQRLQFFPFEQKSYENPFGLDVKPNDLIVLGGLLGR
jgi:hypothetical protein